MNRERAKKLLPIIQAFADGAEIEWKGGVGVGWRTSDGAFANGIEYRIKPKPREGYVRLEDIHDNDGDLDMAGCIKMREVI